MHFVNLPCLGSSWTVLPSEQKERHWVEGLTVFGGRRWLPGCESLLHLADVVMPRSGEFTLVSSLYARVSHST